MEKEIEHYLRILNTDRCINKPKEANLIIEKICQCFKLEQSQFTISLLIDQVLNEEDAIFTFIWKTSSKSETLSSVTGAFKFLDFLVAEFLKLTEPYFKLIFQKCLKLLDNKFSKIKELSLKLLKQLLKTETRVAFDLVQLVSSLEKVVRDSKKAGVVVEQVLSIFGFLCDKHPESVKSRCISIFNEIYETLYYEINISKNPSVPKIKGAFEGLNGFLANYPPTDTDKILKLYEFLKKFSKYQVEKRSVGFIVLKILENHWTHFSRFVFEDREIWKENLGVWIGQGAEERQAAFYGYNGFYNIISVFVKQNVSRMLVLEHFLNDFRETLVSTILNSYEKRSALLGMKLFVLNGCLQGDLFTENCNLILEFSKKQESFNNLMYFPLCVECLSAFIFKSPSNDISEQIFLLQRLSITLISEYPRIDSNYQAVVLTALEMSFYAICSTNLMLIETHLDKVLYQGLVRSCSVLNIGDFEALKEEENIMDAPTYKSYLSLWKYLLNLSSSSNYPPGGSFTLKKSVSQKVIDVTILSFIKIISKLNLNMTLKESESELEMEVENPSDLQIFINIVDLYENVLLKVEPFTFIKWMPKIFESLIYFSEKYPLVAGFYRAVTATFRLSDRAQFFENKSQKCFVLVSRFLENVLLKVARYKGDLQIVCLQTVLAAPACLVEPFVEKIIPVLEITIALGRNHFYLLKNLVETLERWYCSFSLVNIRGVMKKILPHFDLFFQSQYFQGNNLVNSSIEGKKLKKKLMFNDSELLTLQKKFLLFVGSMDVNTALSLVEEPQMEDERKISDRQLCYSSPFGEGNAVLNLNELLPRIMDLSLSCSNRQTRIFACELLYSAVMIILIEINKLSCGYLNIFKRIIRTCIILGSDPDIIVYQIYEPLMFQITHYFSSKKTVNFPESEVVIDILLETVTGANNVAARDFAALLVGEFTDWTIKQLTPEELTTTPKLVQKILDNVYSLAVHPSHYKRLGAALVFNKIYYVLREEDKILCNNWFQLYYYFVESLRMCDDSEDVSEILEAVQHIKRPLVERKEDFNKSSKTRVIPAEFEGGLLCDLVKWTALLCCDLKKPVRHTAMSLVEELAPLTTTNNSLTHFFCNKSKVHKKIILEKTHECSLLKEDEIILWMDYQMAIFEFCTWLLRKKITSVRMFLVGSGMCIIKNFVSGVTSDRCLGNDRSIESEIKMRECVLFFISFVLELKEMFSYFCTEIWPLFKIVVFRPSFLGFDLSHSTTTRSLESPLVDLLLYISGRLTPYDWNKFYEDLENQICVPLLHQMTRSRTVSVSSSEFLFALKVLYKSGLWNDFINRLMFSVDGTLIFEIVFRSLFTTQRNNSVAAFLEPPCRLYLEELLEIGVNVGVNLDDVINFMEDVELVTEEESGKVVTKGEYFHTQFREILFKLFKNKSKEFVDVVLSKGTEKCLNLLIRILESKTICLDDDIPLEIFSRWTEFKKLEERNSLLKEKRILNKLGATASSMMVKPGSLKHTEVAEFIYSYLRNVSFQEIKADELKLICNLLPFLTDFCELEGGNSKLESGLAELLSESNAFCCYVFEPSYESSLKLVFSTLLRSLKLTGSLTVLKICLSIVRWFEKFSRKNEVESALSVFENLPACHAEIALRFTYRTIMDLNNSLDVSRVHHWFMEPLIKISSSEAFIKFTLDNLEELCELITTHWTDKNKKLREFRIDISKKVAAACIIQFFIVKLPNAEYEKMSKKNKDLLVKLVKNCFLLLRKPKPDDKVDTLKEIYLTFMCELFKMICSIISSRCTDPKFYRLFVFPVEDSFLFEAINCSFRYNLDLDFDDIPKRKKIETLIRNIPSTEPRMMKSLKFLQSNTLFTSSLQEDVTRFDLSSASIRPLNSVENSCGLEIELEIDTLNDHECMPALVGVIIKMVAEKITPLPEHGEEIKELPCWLQFFMDSLKSPHLSENQQLFILKAMYNVKDYVEPYSEKVFPAVLETISSLFYGLNYFFIDLIEMLVGWKFIPKSDAIKKKLTKLILLIIDKTYSLRRDIAKNNLNVIKGMIDAWKEGLHLLDLQCYVLKHAFQKFPAAVGEEDDVHYINAKVCKILLSNEIKLWLPEQEMLILKYFVKNLNKENKNRILFAEVCGLSLSLMKYSSQSQTYKECEGFVKEKILSQSGNWLQLLYGVHKYYPKIVSECILKIFSSAWDSTDAFVAEKLEMLLSYVSTLENTDVEVFNRHGHYFLIDMLNSPDILVQQLSLQIALNLVNKLKSDKLKLLMKEVFRLQKSVHSSVRKWVYEVAIKFYPKCEQDCDLGKKCKIVLIKGVNDNVKELEELCVNFWKDLLQCSSTQQTLVKIFQEMYTPEVEDIFVSNTIKMIVESAVISHYFETKLSQQSIVHQSKFQKRTLVLKSTTSSLFGYIPSRIATNQSLEYSATLSSQNIQTNFRRPTSTSKFEPTLREAEVTLGTNTTNFKKPEVPKKKRFYKSEQKTSFSFARWQKYRKKKELEMEEEWWKQKNSEINICGEYRIGDYPDVEIPHSQIVKPLKELASRDNEVARLFLVSFFSGLLESLEEREKKHFLQDMNQIFETTLRTSTSFDPGVFGFILEILLKHKDDLEIDVELVSNAALSSNWLVLGTLIIESSIEKNEGNDIREIKRKKGRKSTEKKRWLELAKLYRSLEEFDVLSGIFLDKLNVLDQEREAVNSEALLDWSSASKHYEAVLKAGESLYSEFFTESYFSCLSKISNWSILNTCIRTTVNENWEELWKNYNLLSWFLKSEMIISLGSENNNFQILMEEFCKSKTKLSILSSNFVEELAVYDWMSEKLQKASYRIDRMCLDFLVGWSHLNQWCYNLRVAKLIELQTAAELGFAIKTLGEYSKPAFEEQMKLGCKNWEKNIPTQGDDLIIWDIKLRYRHKYLNQINNTDLKEVNSICNLALAKAALSQNNLCLAKECLSRVKNVLPEVGSSLKEDFDYCFNLGKMVVAESKMKEGTKGVEMYLSVWKGISNEISSAMDTDSDDSKSHLFRSHFILTDIVTAILPFVKDHNTPTRIAKAINAGMHLPGDSENIVNELKNKGLECLEKARIAAETSNSSSSKSEIYLHLSKFLMKFTQISSSSEFERLGTYLLKAMASGNEEARRLFGCLLNVSLAHADSSSLSNLTTESQNVPSWMFLMWINQIVGSLESNLFPLLKSIILRISEDYPNAVRYPFLLSKDVYKLENPEIRSFVTVLENLLLKDLLFENFLYSMRYLGSPELIMKYYLKKILKEAEEVFPRISLISNMIRELQRLMFDSDLEVFRGKIFNFWSNFNKDIKILILNEENLKVLSREIKRLLSVKEPNYVKDIFSLEFFSPWLKNFHAIKESSEIEMPGQYDGNRKPIKKYLITITSFKNEVVILQSKCKPVRITILGNDANEHKFLIKFGEDLRQDERLQQLFGHLNYKLKENKQTKRFSIDGFKVIPFSNCLGMIEWVDNRASLHEVIAQTLGNESDLMTKAQNKHLLFLSKGTTTDLVRAHLNAFSNMKKKVAVPGFYARVAEFPRDLLKKAFWNLSTSPEHFAYLRENFAVSHAIMSLAHWLVGVGDRHLQNSLVCTKTGRVLGIDFGYAFGFATQFLNPPELVPFRLTPQILGLLHPLDESGWIKQTMVHCLRLFRKEKFLILSVLEVFVKEPLLDWLEQARKDLRRRQEGSDIWYPKQKILGVEQKLNGCNPVTACEAVLKEGHASSEYLINFLEVLKGVEEDNIRARLGSEELLVEEQIECLIDLATDPHVLCKTYLGWNPWL